MGVSYGCVYVCTIQGRREDIEKIPAVVQEIAKKQAKKWYAEDSYEGLAEDLTSCAEEVLAEGGPLAFEFDFDVDDTTHDILEDLLNQLDKALPGLCIFLYRSDFDVEGDFCRPANYISPPGKSVLHVYPFNERKDWKVHPFQDCQELSWLRFPTPYYKYVGKGEEWAITARDFRGCVNLTDIILPPSVTKIAKTAFKDCKNLTIHAWPGSFAETFAKERGIPLELME